MIISPAKTLVFLPENLLRRKKNTPISPQKFPNKTEQTEYLFIMFNNHQPCKNNCFSA